MIKVEDLSFKYKTGKMILEGINLEIKEGEVISIIGKNGSGKSTIAKLLAGITKPSKGKILVDEIDTSDKKSFMKLRKKIGIVFQNPDNQVIFPIVYDDIAFGLNNLQINEIDNKIDTALKKVGMEKYKMADTYELSLGQKQRITIAGVLAMGSKYIILDEPTTMIDSKGKEEIYNIILNLKKEGYTIIYVTNLIDEILLSDRIILLQEGKVKYSFEKKDILNNIDKLEESQIKIPGIVYTILELKKNGINIDLKEWTMDEMVKEIVKVCKK